MVTCPHSDYLADTNILLRLMKSNDPEFRLVRSVVHVVAGRGDRLCYTPQNMVEFWNACTRPADQIRPLTNGS